MAIGLQDIKYKKGAVKKRKRVGRGNASGHGTYSTRGQKGQRARSGGKSGLKRLGFRDVLRRIPKSRGFTSPYLKYETVNLEDIVKNYREGQTVDLKSLKKKGLVGRMESKRGVKILGQGEIAKKLIFKDVVLSESARKKIEKAGGEVK